MWKLFVEENFSVSESFWFWMFFFHLEGISRFIREIFVSQWRNISQRNPYVLPKLLVPIFFSIAGAITTLSKVFCLTVMINLSTNPSLLQRNFSSESFHQKKRLSRLCRKIFVSQYWNVLQRNLSLFQKTSGSVNFFSIREASRFRRNFSSNSTKIFRR